MKKTNKLLIIVLTMLLLLPINEVKAFTERPEKCAHTIYNDKYTTFYKYDDLCGPKPETLRDSRGISDDFKYAYAKTGDGDIRIGFYNSRILQSSSGCNGYYEPVYADEEIKEIDFDDSDYFCIKIYYRNAKKYSSYANTKGNDVCIEKKNGDRIYTNLRYNSDYFANIEASSERKCYGYTKLMIYPDNDSLTAIEKYALPDSSISFSPKDEAVCADGKTLTSYKLTGEDCDSQNGELTMQGSTLTCSREASRDGSTCTFEVEAYCEEGKTSQDGEENNFIQGEPPSCDGENFEAKAIYTITYDLDGGHFIDGRTTLTEYLSGRFSLGKFKINPIKDGYVFDYWADSQGNRYNFGTSPTSNITLKAVYKKLTDDEQKMLSCDEGYVLDYSRATCYKVLNFDSAGKASDVLSTAYNSTADPVAGDAYNYTTYKYNDKQNVCGLNATVNGKVADLTVGKNNATYYFKSGNDNVKYEGQDTFISANSCKFGETYETGSSAECSVTYSAIIYHAVAAKSVEQKVEYTEEDADDVIGEGSEEKEDNNKTNKDISSSPKTGNVLIIIAIIVGAGALGYSGYYFYKRKKEGNNGTDKKSLKDIFKRKEK